jgi:late competence protein required for DNA uptake (superfamily II DNA/RNA helicase)
MGKDKNTFFRCNLPDCNHYVQSKLVKGKRTLCNRCNNEMIMDARAMKLEKPHCVDCIKVRRKPSHDKLLEYIEAQDITTRTQDIKT